MCENILRTAFTTLPDVDVILFVLFAPLRDTFQPLQCLLPEETDLRMLCACSHRHLRPPRLYTTKKNSK